MIGIRVSKMSLKETPEKIDGTNIRVILTDSAVFRGRSDNAQMPLRLLANLMDTFDTESILEQTDDLCLYGEGAGAGIQKGDRYGSEQFFTMFDAMTAHGWASRRNMLAIAEKFGILTVPEVFTGTITEAVEIVKFGLVSHYGHFFAEGLVGRPTSELANQWGDRIITKIKHRDFYEGTS
jgi:ATP-dependent RNA circularization protein (DNA/RNA ligase family)